MYKIFSRNFYIILCTWLVLLISFPTVTTFAENTSVQSSEKINKTTETSKNSAKNTTSTADKEINQNANNQNANNQNKNNISKANLSPTAAGECEWYDLRCSKVVNYVLDKTTSTSTPKPKKPNPNYPSIDDCEHWYDIGCQIRIDLFYLNKSLLFLATSILDSFLFKASNVLTNPSVDYFFKGFQKLSWTFLLLFLTYQTIRILTLYAFQENQSQLMPLLRKVLFAAVMIGSLPWICSQLIILNNDIVTAIVGTMTVSSKINPLLTYDQIRFMLVLNLILAICCLIVAFQMLVRYAELALLIAIGPIAIATSINQEFNLFPNWWRNVLAVIFTQTIQVLILVMGIKMVLDVKEITGTPRYFYIIGFLILLIRTPKFLKEWLHSTGTVDIAKTAVSRLTSI